MHKEYEDIDKLNVEQRDVFDRVFVNIDTSKKSIQSISGSAGTGKTFLTQVISEMLFDYMEWVTAPTHKAVSVLKGKFDRVNSATIHSFLGLELKTNFETGKHFLQRAKRHNVRNCDVLIVDEASMISAELFGHITSAWRKGEFKHIIFVGDVLQLQPVDENSETSDMLAFTSDLIQHHFDLKQIVRSKHTHIYTLFNHIRHLIEDGKTRQEALEYLWKYNAPEVIMYSDKSEFLKRFINTSTLEDETYSIGSFTNAVVNDRNYKIRNFYHKMKGNVPSQIHIEDILVIQKANNKDFSTSETVKIASIQHTRKSGYGAIKIYTIDNRMLYVLDDKDRVRYAKETIKLKDEAKKKRAWKKYYSHMELFSEVSFHYSSTIHKLQGSTYKDIFVDLTDIPSMTSDDMFLRLLYVGITRAEDKIHILAQQTTANAMADLDAMLNL